MDATTVGQLAADTMQTLADLGEEFTIRSAVVVVEVDNGPSTGLVTRCSDDRPWFMQALLGEAIDAIQRQRDCAPTESDE